MKGLLLFIVLALAALVFALVKDARGAPDTNGVDREAQTFPLGRKFPDVVTACFTQKGAAKVARAQAEGDEAANIKAYRYGCFAGQFPVTYLRLAESVKAMGTRLNIYECVIGSETVFCLTTWTHQVYGREV